MGAQPKRKIAVDEEVQLKKETAQQKEKPAFYQEPLFWVRIGVALVFLMMALQYFVFSK